MRTALALMAFAGVLLGQAPSFNSGSTGSDGALTLMTPGTIIFDPRDTATFGRILDPDGDGIYHFTITVGPDVTVKFSAQKHPAPVYWLAQGAIQINGTLDLNGENGASGFQNIPKRVVLAIAGSGGYAGGISSFFPPDGSPALPPQPGSGPGGGAIGTWPRPNCSNEDQGGNGTFTGNQFLVPLVGGSGGGGYIHSGGGAGGGAILLASSTSVTVNGMVTADGGLPGCNNCCSGGLGSAGAIRIAANSFSGAGTLLVGRNLASCSLFGRIRIEAYQNTFVGNIPACFNGSAYVSPVSHGTPFNTFLPTTPPPSVRLLTINGISVPESPNGSFVVPDVVMTATSAVPVVVEAKNIPLGTVITLMLYSETGADQTIPLPPLAGTLALSTAQRNVTFPSGFSRGFLRAQWTQ